MLSSGSGLSVVAFELAKLLGGVRASKVIHPFLLRRVLQAPLFFFESTPVGRILSRFSKDINVVDNSIADLLGSASWNCLKVTLYVYVDMLIPTYYMYVYLKNACNYNRFVEFEPLHIFNLIVRIKKLGS